MSSPISNNIRNKAIEMENKRHLNEIAYIERHGRGSNTNIVDMSGESVFMNDERKITDVKYSFLFRDNGELKLFTKSIDGNNRCTVIIKSESDNSPADSDSDSDSDSSKSVHTKMVQVKQRMTPKIKNIDGKNYYVKSNKPVGRPKRKNAPESSVPPMHTPMKKKLRSHFIVENDDEDYNE